MPEEIKKQVQFFNKILTLFIVIFVIMTVIIAAMLVMGSIRDSKLEKLESTTIKLENKTASLDNVIRDTLEKYQPDRAAQQLSRETIQDINKTVTEILEEQSILLK